MAVNFDRQIGRLTTFAFEHRISISYVIEEVASGVNENRKGYNYLETFCKSYGVDIITIEQPEKKELKEKWLRISSLL
jgi:putative resolvase